LAAWVKAMTKHILAAICLHAATPAVAQNSSAIPPPEYDFPFKGKLTIERTSYQHVVRQNCSYSPFPYLLGCARLRGEECYILMMDDAFLNKMNYPPEIVLRHEMGHCNGWPAHRPGGRLP
jgi:hypothetical protein